MVRDLYLTDIDTSYHRSTVNSLKHIVSMRTNIRGTPPMQILGFAPFLSV